MATRKKERGQYLWVIDQACSVKEAGYWPSSIFACLSRLRLGAETRKKRNKKISSHLDRTSLVNKGFIIGFSGQFFLRGAAGSPERVR